MVGGTVVDEIAGEVVDGLPVVCGVVVGVGAAVVGGGAVVERAVSSVGETVIELESGGSESPQAASPASASVRTERARATFMTI